MTLGYFPGCSLEGTAEEFGMSIRAVVEKLDLELAEIEDWNCCGASAAHQTNHVLGLALPARTLALAAAQGMESVLAPCAACSNRLIAAQREIAEKPDMRKAVEKTLARPLPSRPIAIVNLIQFFLNNLDCIRSAVTAPLAGKKIACYYGCLLLRPPSVVAFDDPEMPSSMERVVDALGAEAVSWGFRTECCGAAFAMSSTTSVVRLVERILRNAHEAGAAAVATACPLCHANLDLRQRKRSLGFRMPILYLSQLVGLALNLAPRELGLNKHMTPVKAVLR
jgi:heterodisulfide reductase subunit B2